MHPGKRRGRIGIFGGTLDPVHMGHLRTAEEIREAFNLDEIWFIPAARPPHKDRPGITPFHHRLRMAEIAVESNSCFKVLDIEARRSGPSYSIDTLRELRAIYPALQDLYFILGSDAFLDIEQWKEYRGLVNLCSIIIMSRENAICGDAETIIARAWPESIKQRDGCFECDRGGKIFYHRVTHLEISGTDIRKRAAAGMSVRYLVPEKIREYMETNRLYLNEQSNSSESNHVQTTSGEIVTPDPESQRAVAIARAIHDNRGEDITVLDIREFSSFTDFFIIAHGRSTRHVEGITDKIRRSLRKMKIRCRGIEGENEAKWVLMDFDDCVVHLFYEPVRSFYDLEGLWADAPRLAWQDEYVQVQT